MSIDYSETPSTSLYFHISGEKWDMDHQRNALLHYIESKGLSDECLTWLQENAEPGWFREEED